MQRRRQHASDVPGSASQIIHFAALRDVGPGNHGHRRRSHVIPRRLLLAAPARLAGEHVKGPVSHSLRHEHSPRMDVETIIITLCYLCHMGMQ